jgi:hypothetical protein
MDQADLNHVLAALFPDAVEQLWRALLQRSEGQPNQERSSRPVLTVLLLLSSVRPEEGEWGESSRT